MRKPTAPSNFQTPDGPTRVDLRRLQQTQADTIDYFAELMASLAASTFSQADADALYLKRAAGDYATFAAKATAAAADVLLIEDSAAAGAKKATTVSGLAVPLNIPTRNPWLEPPVVAHADNDEFTSWAVGTGGTPWTIWDATDSVEVTVESPNTFDPWGTAPATHKYRWKIAQSAVMLQLPNDTHLYYVYKAVTPANGMFLTAQASITADAAGGSNAASADLRFGIFPAASGRPTITGAVAILWRNSGSNGLRLAYLVNTTTTNVGTNLTADRAAPTLMGVMSLSSSDHRLVVADEYGQATSLTLTGGDVSVTTAYAGWTVQKASASTSGNPFQGWLTLGFFRRLDDSKAWMV